MDFYEAQDFFKKMHPNDLVVFDFDDKCIRQMECVYTDGELHSLNHIEYQKVKVSVNGKEEFYCPIKPHRMIVTAKTLKEKISKDNIFIHDDEKIEIQEMLEKMILQLKINWSTFLILQE